MHRFDSRLSRSVLVQRSCDRTQLDQQRDIEAFGHCSLHQHSMLFLQLLLLCLDLGQQLLLGCFTIFASIIVKGCARHAPFLLSRLCSVMLIFPAAFEPLNRKVAVVNLTHATSGKNMLLSNTSVPRIFSSGGDLQISAVL